MPTASVTNPGLSIRVPPIRISAPSASSIGGIRTEDNGTVSACQAPRPRVSRGLDGVRALVIPGVCALTTLVLPLVGSSRESDALAGALGIFVESALVFPVAGIHRSP